MHALETEKTLHAHGVCPKIEIFCFVLVHYYQNIICLGKSSVSYQT
jgi:hypothetical protein